MGQEGSTDVTPSDLSDATKINSENQAEIESLNTDIYSRQNYSYQMALDSYMKKSKPSEESQLFVDNFYIEILKGYNQQILRKSNFINIQNINSNNKLDNIALKNDNQSEIEQIIHETNEIYDHKLPALVTYNCNLKNLIEIKKQPSATKNECNEESQIFSPDCTILNS